MTHAKLILLNYFLNSLWQVPLVFLAAAAAARLARSAGPAVEHRIWVAALMLESILPACWFAPALRDLLLSLVHGGTGSVSTQVTMVAGTAAPHGSLYPLSLITHLALIGYLVLVLFFTARFALSFYRTRTLRRNSQPVTLAGEPLSIWQRCARIFPVRDAQIATSAQIVGPSTVGVRRRIIVLPPALLTDFSHEDLAAALAHEFAHMQRRDFLKNLIYQVISLPIAYHPLLFLTRLRLAESREMVCDELAAEATHGTTRYAHSLLRLAASFSRRTPAPTLHAIGILDANVLERRVMTLNRKHTLAAASRRASIAAAIALGVTTCASAMSLRLEIPAYALAAPAAPAAAQEANGPVRIAGGVAAGKIISKVQPVYPPEAKAQGIQGTVVLHAVIGRDGTVQQLAVISGPPELAKAAIEAVKQWTYQPYLLNGDPVEVETTITVNFSLNGRNAPPPPPPPPPGNPQEAASQTSAPVNGVYRVGGSIRPPVATYTPDPEYTVAARKAKLSGNVIVALVVGPDGQPYNVHVAHGLGNALDQKAVEAVQQYRFNPATKDGEPVAVALNVEVNFRIF